MNMQKKESDYSGSFSYILIFKIAYINPTMMPLIWVRFDVRLELASKTLYIKNINIMMYKIFLRSFGFL